MFSGCARACSAAWLEGPCRCPFTVAQVRNHLLCAEVVPLPSAPALGKQGSPVPGEPGVHCLRQGSGRQGRRISCVFLIMGKEALRVLPVSFLPEEQQDCGVGFCSFFSSREPSRGLRDGNKQDIESSLPDNPQSPKEGLMYPKL